MLVPEESVESIAALSEEDRIAIDLLLNRSEAIDETPTHAMAALAGGFADRVEFFGAIVKLLNEFSVPEPSIDLLARLHARIDAGEMTMIAPVVPVTNMTDLPAAMMLGEELKNDES